MTDINFTLHGDISLSTPRIHLNGNERFIEVMKNKRSCTTVTGYVSVYFQITILSLWVFFSAKSIYQQNLCNVLIFNQKQELIFLNGQKQNQKSRKETIIQFDL